MLVKDLDGMTAGDPYHAGTNHLKRLGYVADHDSSLQARFKQAGLVILGRTNTPELGLVTTTEPEAYGPTRNPWDTRRSTGGSSGGSAAAVASGMVPLAHAGDGGGSIRIPASECGLVGLFPSRGRHSLGPEVGEAWGGLVRRLVVSRSVRDTAVSLDAVQGWMPGDPYAAPPPARPFAEEVGAAPGRLRIGIRTQAGDPATVTHADCIAATEHAGRLLESLGHDVGPADHELFDDADFQAAFTGHFINAFSVWTAEELDHIGQMSGEPVTADGVEAGTWAVAEMGRAVSGVAFQEALTAFSVFTRRMGRWWADGNDLCSPRPSPSRHPSWASSRRRPRTRSTACSGRHRSCSSPSRSTSPASRRSRSRCSGTTTGSRSACSWSPPTGARTCCCGWPRSSRRPRRGPIAGLPSSLPDGARRPPGSPRQVNGPDEVGSAVAQGASEPGGAVPEVDDLVVPVGIVHDRGIVVGTEAFPSTERGVVDEVVVEAIRVGSGRGGR